MLNWIKTIIQTIGYPGVELAKAGTAPRLGLDYEQDHPLKKTDDSWLTR